MIDKQKLQWEVERQRPARSYQPAEGSAMLFAVSVAAVLILVFVVYTLIDRWLLW